MKTRDWARVALAMFAVGWGANQFAPMLQVYRRLDGLSQQTVTAMFGVYVAGLVPALLLAGWWSRHVGKRPFVRLALVAAVVASALLALGALGEGWLYAGRLVAGLAAGAVMGPGTAWVTELSDTPGRGARRATIALSGGFGLGPLVAGLAVTVLPAPKVTPYLIHLALGVVAAALAWTAAEPDTSDHPTPGWREVAAAVGSRWFLGRLLLTAPWVFGMASVSFVVLPTAVDGLAGLEAPAIGVVAFLTLGSGVLIQPTIRRLEERHSSKVLPLALVGVVAAMALGIVLAQTRSLALLPVAAVVFGLSYGTLLVGGLRTVATHVDAALLAPVNAVFYCLTYIGFLAPFVIAVVASVVPLTWTLGIGLAIAAASLPVVWASGRLRLNPGVPRRRDRT